MTAHQDLDPITLEIVFNALRSITDETFIALTKSAYSTNIKERRDHSTAICDLDGRLIVQAENSLPIHLASMTGLMASLLAKYDLADIEEGDLFVANDPHVAGGTHLPDINLAMPVFVDDKLSAFVCNIAHHADVGGMAPGSMAGGMSEIYQEGLRIPVVKLFRRGELQEDLFGREVHVVGRPHQADHRPMGDVGPLGLARGTRGVHDVGGLLRRRRSRWIARPVGPLETIDPQHVDPCRHGGPLDVRHRIAMGQQSTDPGIFHHETHSLGWILGVQRDIRST